MCLAWWCRYLISQHPKVEQLIAEELDKHGLLAKAGSAPRNIEYEDLSKLTYLNCVIKVGVSWSCTWMESNAWSYDA